MEKVSYHKLVRDKIPAILDEKGVPHEKHIASEDEYPEMLLRRLDEEVHEFLEIHSAEELADIIEVVEAIKKLPGFEDIDAVRQKKRDERGGFDEKIIIKGSY